MKRSIIMVFCLALAAAFVGVPAAPSFGQEKGDWESMKKDAKRAELNATADEALKELLGQSDKAKQLYGKSYGWAVFDNMKITVGLSGGGGNGVAVAKGSGKRTYMKMGTVGVSIGIGAKKYQVVFLFEDEGTFAKFVDKGWQADATASAVAGTAGAEGQTGFSNGMASYVLTDKGLMAAADLSGTKYFKNKKLN
jgi:lipid-binding SYLF domain-containing protein